MRRIVVDLGPRSYPVLIGDGILARAGRELKRLGFSNAPIVVTNAPVFRLHGEALRDSLEHAFGRTAVIRMGDGEAHKNSATVSRIYDALFRLKADRRSWIVAFGGGVVGDAAGFAAATFMRGIPYVNVATTMLAQVDSALGGKVGINVPQGKNLVGAFHQPSAVLSDTGLLRTLPPRELASGLYEIVKAAAIRSTGLLRYLEKNREEILECRPRALEQIVYQACRIKAEVVSGDEREEETRMILNYGHTVGHALEAATAYRRFAHGEAVAWGMIAAVGFGRTLGYLKDEEARRLVSLIHKVEALPPLHGISLSDVWSALKRDKKFRSGRIRMVVLPQLGATEILSNVDAAALKRFLLEFLSRGGDVFSTVQPR